MRTAEIPVQLLRHPAEADRRNAFAAAGVPVLLLVEGDVAPAALHPLEACTTVHVDPTELRGLMRVLEARACTWAEVAIDQDDILHHDGRWVALPPGEVPLAQVLVEHLGEIVPTAELERATGRVLAPDSSYLRLRMRRLRQHLVTVGLELRNVPRQGYALVRP